MHGNKIFFLVMVLTATAAVGGCGKKDPNLPDLVPVTGTVKLDGQPLSEAVVFFSPVGETRGTQAFGKTDSRGRYSLSSRHMGEGAPVGEYRVTIGKAVAPDGSTAGGKNFDPMTTPTRQILPAKYSHPSSTILKATVREAGDDIDFELTSK
jgi:hypothetical protein